MKSSILVGFAMISFVSTAFAAEPARIATFSTGADVSAFLSGGELKGGSAQFSKFSLVFNEPKELERIEFKSCENEIKDGVDLFFDPGFRRAFLEGGVKKFKVDVPREPVRSIAIVFGLNQDYCVKGLKITAKGGKTLELEVPQGAGVKAASVETSELRKIASTSFASMIDRELAAKIDDKETWIFRFRGDGTYFIRGFGDDMSEASSFSSLGTYKIDKSTKAGARLKLDGVRVPTAIAWDGVLCPVLCGGASDPKQQVVFDVVELEETKGSAVMIRNRESRSKRTLPFSDLKSRNSAFED